MIDAHEIVPQLWQGSLPNPGPELAAAGFDVLVLCARDHQPSSSLFPGVTVLHAPNDDHGFVSDKDLKLATATATRLAEMLRGGSKVLVTCFAGVNRSGFVVALTIHKTFGYSGKTCITLVRHGRRLGDSRALTNTLFLEILEKLSGHELALPMFSPLDDGNVKFFWPKGS